MDAFISKLKSTVAEALPGSPLGQDFDIQAVTASAGPGLLWKVHNATQKSTKHQVSVFVFEKKSIEKLSKNERKQVIETLKQGAQQLTRLRHPKVLSVVYPLEENRECLSFATEPVLCSLADVLGYAPRGGTEQEDLSAVVASEPASPSSSKLKMEDVEIKYGLLQVLEGLSFLHNDAKMIHGGLFPGSVVINKNGIWKLCGFEFALASSNGPGQPAMYTCKPWVNGQCAYIQPDLDYVAPEWALSTTCDAMSDMFSLGVLVHAIYNDGKPVLECGGLLSLYKSKSAELKKLKMSSLMKIPESMRELMSLLLNPDPNVRPDANQLAKIPYFEDVSVATLQYVDTLIQRDNLQKSQFFKSLPKVLGQLPLRLCLLRVLPALFQECVNHDMIPFVLANVVAVLERASNDEHARHIFPHLIPIFKINKPIQIPLIFMQNMALLLNKTPTADIKNHVLPMVYRSLEIQSENSQLQELCLGILPSFSNLIDNAAMKNAVIPRMKKLCLETGVLSVRVQCLVCLGKMLDHIDKWVVLDDILPFLPTVPSREAPVLMSILGIYRVAFAHSSLGISKEMLATKILPFLLPLCVDSSLNLMQFNAYMLVIKEMLDKVEMEQRTKLEQVHNMDQEQRSLSIGGTSSSSKEDAVMDGFLSSVGLLTSSSAQTNGNARSAAIAGAQLASRNSTAGGSTATLNQLPSSAEPLKKAAAALTLEDKQRLVRKQELQERLRSEPRMVPGASDTERQSQQTSVAARVPSTPQVKDLTHMLTANSGHGSPMVFAAPSKALGDSSLTDSSWSTAPAMGITTPKGVTPSPGGAAQLTGNWQLGTTLLPPSTRGSAAAGQVLDLSAFDSLLTMPSSQSKPSLAFSAGMTAPAPAAHATQRPPQLLAQSPAFAAYAQQSANSRLGNFMLPPPPGSSLAARQQPTMAGAGGSSLLHVSPAPQLLSGQSAAVATTKLNPKDIDDLLG